MDSGQGIGNRHGYCDAHEESKRGDEEEGGGSDHVDVAMLVLVGLKAFGNTRVLLILVCKSLSLKAWVLNLVRGDLIRTRMSLEVLELAKIWHRLESWCFSEPCVVCC